MKSKFFQVLGALLILSGALAMQACFYTGPPSWYGPGPSAQGDYDEGHTWHDRSWWISNRHDWVHQNHPDWVSNETPQEHEAYEHHN
jgi:hypothetical protein